MKPYLLHEGGNLGRRTGRDVEMKVFVLLTFFRECQAGSVTTIILTEAAIAPSPQAPCGGHGNSIGCTLASLTDSDLVFIRHSSERFKFGDCLQYISRDGEDR